jgi:replication factor C small subunit
MMSEDFLMWIEKYRPHILDDVVNQEETVLSLKSFLKHTETLPHLLFAGPPGTGKTSVAICIAKEILGTGWRSSTLEMNASDERKIEDVRQTVKQFSQISKIGSEKTRYGFIILDECDEMTGPAQNALRRIMETSSMITRFILICNYLSGIIPPIQSRCAIFQFKRIGEEDIESYLLQITKQEKITLTKEGVKMIIELCEGDLRKAINTLQTAAALSNGKIDEKIILKIARQATPNEIQTMLDLAIRGDFEKARNQMYQLMIKHALSGRDIIKQLHREISRTTLLTPNQRLKVTSILGDFDFRLMEGANEDIQLSAFLAQLTQIGSDKS